MRKLVPVATLFLAVALVLHPLALAGSSWPLITLGALCIACCLLALMTSEWIMSGPGIILLLSQYTVALVDQRGDLDELGPVFAVGAFLLMELTDVALTLARSDRIAPEVVGVRTRQLLVVAGAGGVVAALVIFAGALTVGREAVLLAAGAACAAGAVLLGVGLAHDVLEAPPET